MDATDPIGPMSFEEKIVVLLKRRNMSHAELARRIGSNPNSVSNWLTKGWRPRLVMAVKLAHVLGTTVDYLMSEEGIEEPEAPPESVP